MTNTQLTIFVLAAIVFAVLFGLSFIKIKKPILKFQAREDKDHMFNFIAKIMAFVVFVLYVTRFIYPEAFDAIVNRDRLFSPDTIVIMAIVRTSLSGAIFFILIAPWFNYRPMRNIVAVFGTIAYVISILLFKQNIQAMQGLEITSPTRVTTFAIELGVGLGLCLFYLSKLIKDLMKRQDILNIRKILIDSALSIGLYVVFSVLTADLYIYQNLFDVSKNDSPVDFNSTHIMLLLIMIFVTLVLSIIFRNVKDKKYLHCFLSLFALVCLLDYIVPMKYIDIESQPWKLPLHLCNTGVFLMFFSLTTRSKPLFYFNYLVNIIGAVFALVMPDYGDNAHLWNEQFMHFWVNHYLLFILPIVAVAGGHYERPKLKYVFYSIAVFIAYFFLVAFLDAYWKDQVNFFFLNGDSIISKFVFSAGFKDEQFTAFIPFMNTNLRIFWLYWILVFIFYLGFIFGVWFVFASLYQISDGYADLINRAREKSKANRFLRKELNGRKTDEPIHPENVGKVVIKHFSKIYDGETVKAVDDLSLEIKPGSVYGFLGHNGAGKSTTIKSLVGIQTITEGTIEIDGYDILLQPLEAKMKIGYVSDNHTVYEHLTGREYINYVADLYLVNKEDRDKRIEKYVKMFNLEDAIDREIKGYSHGMKQKIVVISSLIHEPKVWVLDEPLTGLDPTSSYQIKTIMKQYAEKGNIVFFSSHVIEVVEKICDTVSIIGHGKFVGEWKIADLKNQGLTLQDLYVKYVKYKDGDTK